MRVGEIAMQMLSQWIGHVLDWLTSLGYWGVMLGLMIEVIPSEIVLAFAGYLVSKGEITFLGAVLFGTVGGVLAQIFLYWLGRYGGRPFLEKYGKYLLIQRKHLDLSEQWFAKYGAGVIFSARFIPVVRHAISVPAGIVRMPLWKFTLLTTLAVIPWSVFFIYMGKTLGDNWQHVDEIAERYAWPFIIGALLVAGLYIAWKTARGRSRASRTPARSGERGERAVAHELKHLGREYVVFHNIRLSAGGSRQQIDHLVIGPEGVFHIETKHWSGEIRFTGSGLERSANKPGADPTGQLYRHEYVIREILRRSRLDCDVTGILCFTHPECRIVGESPGFATVRPDRLLHVIRSHRARRGLSPGEIRALAGAVRRHTI
jgi:membrane protein DedA with SNARE-associated domain